MVQIKILQRKRKANVIMFRATLFPKHLGKYWKNISKFIETPTPNPPKEKHGNVQRYFDKIKFSSNCRSSVIKGNKKGFLAARVFLKIPAPTSVVSS